MKQVPTGIAIFDFDGTISDRDSFLAFIQYTHGSWALWWGLFRHAFSIFRYLLGLLPNYRLKEVVFTHFYGGYSSTELQQRARQFSQTVLPNMIYQGALDQIRWHQSRGDRIIILSASARLWLAPWCTQHGFDLISSEFEVQESCYTGRLSGVNCYGPEKERRIKPLLDAYAPEKCYGYGDSEADRFYLQHCGKASYLPLRTALRPFYFRSHARWSPLFYRFLRLIFAGLFLLLPFSISFDLGLHQVNIPSEPLLLLGATAGVFWFWQHGLWPNAHYASPLFLASLVLFVVYGFSTVFSTAPMVSIKYSFIAILHWWVFFHCLPLLFDWRPQSILQLAALYMVSFLAILAYAWYQHAQYDFRIDVSVLTARPFYFDHALYSSVILLLLGPVIIRVLTIKVSLDRLLSLLALLLLLTGLYLSFSRAAWLSALLSVGLILGLVLFKLRFWHLLSVGGFALVLLYLGQPIILEQLRLNASPSKSESQSEHLRSALNITTDVSNLERINRYSCAWRMFLDRPHTGFGPGTFQFAYLSYQLPGQMTPISVTEPGRHRPGKGGGAHSEYLQALSEMGWPGLLTWLLLLGTVFWSGLQIYHGHAAAWMPPLSIGLLFSLSTYFVHGLVNNFLHHDKVAALFWLYLAVLHQLSCPSRPQ